MEFMRKEAAEHALSLDGTSFMSRILKVKTRMLGILVFERYGCLYFACLFVAVRFVRVVSVSKLECLSTPFFSKPSLQVMK